MAIIQDAFNPANFQPSGPAAVADEPQGNEFARGLRGGANSFMSGINNAMGGVAQPLGYEDFAQGRFKAGAEYEKQAELEGPSVKSLRDIHGVGDAARFMMGGLGQTALPAAIGVGAGLLTKSPGKGLAAATAAMTPETFGHAVGEYRHTNHDAPVDPNTALRLGGTAVASSAIQNIVPAGVGSMLRGGGAAANAARGFMPTMGRAVATDIGGNAVAGGVADVVTQAGVNPGKDLDMGRSIEAAATGGVMGVPFVGAHAVGYGIHSAPRAGVDAAITGAKSIKDRLKEKAGALLGAEPVVEKAKPVDHVDALNEISSRVEDPMVETLAAGGRPDPTLEATAEGQAKNDQTAFEWAKTKGEELMKSTGLTKDNFEALSQAMQNLENPAAQKTVALITEGAEKAKGFGKTVADLGKALDKHMVERSAAAGETKKSEDYSGMRAAISEHIVPWLQKNKPEALGDRASIDSLADNLRKFITAASDHSDNPYSSDAAHAMTSIFGKDTITILSKIHDSVGDGDMKSAANFLRNLNEMEADRSSSKSLIDFVAASAQPGKLNLAHAGDLTHELIKWANTEHAPNKSVVLSDVASQRAKLENTRMASALEDIFGDKADGVEQALKVHVLKKRDEYGTQGIKKAPLESETSEAHEPGHVDTDGEYHGPATEEALDRVVYKKDAKSKAPDAVMNPAVFDSSRQEGQNYGKQQLEDAKAKYPGHDVRWVSGDELTKMTGQTHAGGKDAGHIIAERAADPERITPAELKTMTLDAKRHNSSKSRINATGADGKPLILDAVGITKAMLGKIRKEEGETFADLEKRAFLSGTAELMREHGKFDIPPETVISYSGGGATKFGDINKLGRVVEESVASAGMTNVELKRAEALHDLTSPELMKHEVAYGKELERRADAMKDSIKSDLQGSGLSDKAYKEKFGQMMRDPARKDTYGIIEMEKALSSIEQVRKSRTTKDESADPSKDAEIHEAASRLKPDDLRVGANMDGTGRYTPKRGKSDHDAAVMDMAQELKARTDLGARALGAKLESLSKIMKFLPDAERESLIIASAPKASKFNVDGTPRSAPVRNMPMSERLALVNPFAEKYKGKTEADYIDAAPKTVIDGPRPVPDAVKEVPFAEQQARREKDDAAALANLSVGKKTAVRWENAEDGSADWGQERQVLIHYSDGSSAEKFIDAGLSDRYAPKTVAKEATNTPAKTESILAKQIDKRQEYLNNPPENYSTEVAKGHLDWAARQLERVDTEYEKAKGDAGRQDQLGDYRSSLKRLMTKAKSVIEGDASLAEKEGTPDPKLVAAKKAALIEGAASGDKPLLKELSTSDDAKGLQRAAEVLAESAPESKALAAANERLATLVQDPATAYGMQTTKYSLQETRADLGSSGRYIIKLTEDGSGYEAINNATGERSLWGDAASEREMRTGSAFESIDSAFSEAGTTRRESLDRRIAKLIFDAADDIKKPALDLAVMLDEGAPIEKVDHLISQLEDIGRKFDKTSTGAGPKRPTDFQPAKEYLTKVAPWVKTMLSNISHAGEFTHSIAGDVIRLSTHALNPLSTAHHESLHAFFQKLREAGATDVMDVLNKAAASPHVMKQLREFLKNEPAALKQLSDPEERAAYMYQMHALGELKLPPAATTIMGKIKDMLMKALGMWTNDARALHIMDYFQTGEYAQSMGNPSAVHRAMMDKGRNQAVEKLTAMAKPLSDLGMAVVGIGSQRLRDTGIPALRQVADLVKATGREDHNDKGYLPTARDERATRMNAISSKLEGYTTEDMGDALGSMQRGVEAKTEKGRAVQRVVQSALADTLKYMQKAGVDIEHIGAKDGVPYFPRVWDTGYISKNKADFMDMLSKYERRGELDSAQKLMDSMIARDGAEFGVENREPGMQFKKQRTLAFISHADAAVFMSKDLNQTLNSYITQATRRAEWSRRFADDGSTLDGMLAKAKEQGATEQHLAMTEQYLKGVDGTLGDSLDPRYRRLMGDAIVYQNIRLLPLAIFSSVVDPVGLMVNGASAKEAWSTFKRGIREVPLGFKDQSKQAKDHWTEMSETLGVIDNATLHQSIGALYSQGMVGDTARKINDTFFKLNLMEQFNRSMRIGATEAATRFIAKHAVDGESTHSTRWLAELGLKSSDVKMHEGALALTEAHGLTAAEATKMRSAVNQWVDGAVLRPDAADKPIWMNDPRYMLVSHLKQFVYSFHQTILKKVAHEFQHGNTGPALALASYVPIMIAADMMKGMIQGAGSQPDFKEGWGLGDYVWSGLQRAGLFGVGQFGVDIATNVQRGGLGVGALAGPTLGQMGDVLELMGGHKQFGPVALHAMPANALYSGLVKGSSQADPMFAD